MVRLRPCCVIVWGVPSVRAVSRVRGCGGLWLTYKPIAHLRHASPVPRSTNNQESELRRRNDRRRRDTAQIGAGRRPRSRRPQATRVQISPCAFVSLPPVFGRLQPHRARFVCITFCGSHNRATIDSAEGILAFESCPYASCWPISVAIGCVSSFENE